MIRGIAQSDNAMKMAYNPPSSKPRPVTGPKENTDAQSS